MPTIFFGHGNPMNAIRSNTWTRAWSDIGKALPTPTAILSISAHWYVRGVAVTASDAPRTIHDFGGFPDELFACRYPAKGDISLCRRVQQLLAPMNVTFDRSWGLDHGTWSVLYHVFPHADVAVVQLSIDETKPPQFHYELGRKLRQLREEGVLVIGSGDIVHNLHTYAWAGRPAQPYDWAARFDQKTRELIMRRDHTPLIQYESLGNDARLSVPTPEHYLPLLYVLGASTEEDVVSFPVDGIDGGSVSMLAVQFAD